MTETDHLTISLSGASWGCLFYIGFYKGLIKEYKDENIGKKINIYGNSAGALIALGIALGYSVSNIEDIYKYLSSQAIENGVMGKMTIYHENCLNKFLKNKTDYLLVNNRLHVGITTKSGHIFINQFTSNEHLKHILHCSFYVPFYCTYKAIYNGEQVIDGSIGFNYESLSRNIISVGVSDNFDYDISIKLPTSVCYKPIINDNYNKIFNQGYNQTLKYLKKNKRKINKFQPKFLNLNVKQLFITAKISSFFL